MNTGIMEDMPIILPNSPVIFMRLFKALEKLYSEENMHSGNREIIFYLENVANALVYSLYLLNDDELMQIVDRSMKYCKSDHYSELHKKLCEPKISRCVEKVLQNPVVQSIENSPRMN